jgi:hypothetical protein
MKTKKDRFMDARRLALTDADIAHLRFAIEASLRDAHAALPPAYWRARLEKLTTDERLLPAQAQQIRELIERLDADASDPSQPE